MLASAHFNGPYKNNWGGEKNFTIAISANWSGMQLFPRSTSLFRKKTSHLTASWKGNLAGHVTRAPWGVTNLSAGPKKKKKPPMLRVQRFFTCTLEQRHMYSTVCSLFPPTSLFARAIFFDQKHFLRICCPPSDDFQTTPVIWWWTDGSQSWTCLGKAFVLVWAQWTLRPESLPGRHMWTRISPQT